MNIINSVDIEKVISRIYIFKIQIQTVRIFAGALSRVQNQISNYTIAGTIWCLEFCGLVTIGIVVYGYFNVIPVISAAFKVFDYNG